jgi:hypothetical protein
MGRTAVPIVRRVRFGRRVVAASLLGLTLALAAPGMAAADPPVEPQLPPIVGTFHVNPIAVPVGGTLVYQGFCGFPAVEVLPAIVTPFGFVHFFGFTPINTTPFGVFSVKVTVPAIGNVGIGGTPITPGGYFATVACIGPDGESKVLPSDFFEIVATRGGGRGGGGRG